MKTFASLAAMCMLASANAVILDSALSESESLTFSRAETYPSSTYENVVLTQTDGYATVTALNEGDAIAVGTARSSGSADGYSDVSSALAETYILARGFKDGEAALSYSESEALTETAAEPTGLAESTSGMGIAGSVPFNPLLEPQHNLGGALASLIRSPYPHQSAVYSRSEGQSVSDGIFEETDTYTNTEQVAVIDIIGLTGMYADALASSWAIAEAEYGSTD